MEENSCSEGTKARGVNNLVGTDRGGCNKYDIVGAGLVKSLSRPGGEAGSVPAPHICAWAGNSCLTVDIPAARRRECTMLFAIVTTHYHDACGTMECAERF